MARRLRDEGAVFLTLDFVSARSQSSNLLPRQSLVQNQKSSLRRATSFLSMLPSLTTNAVTERQRRMKAAVFYQTSKSQRPNVNIECGPAFFETTARCWRGAAKNWPQKGTKGATLGMKIEDRRWQDRRARSDDALPCKAKAEIWKVEIGTNAKTRSLRSDPPSLKLRRGAGAGRQKRSSKIQALQAPCLSQRRKLKLGKLKAESFGLPRSACRVQLCQKLVSTDPFPLYFCLHSFNHRVKTSAILSWFVVCNEMQHRVT